MSEADMDIAVSAGVTVLGFVSDMPSGPGILPLTAIKALMNRVPLGVAGTLLTSEVDPGTISAQIDYVGAKFIQLVRPMDASSVKQLRVLQPEVTVVVVVHVVGGSAYQYARGFYDVADYLLLDTGDFISDPIELGGTGRRHDWTISRRIVDDSPLPVFLAGGLNSENVESAIAIVRPYGVDVCSGVRHGGRLHRDRLQLFLASLAPW